MEEQNGIKIERLENGTVRIYPFAGVDGTRIWVGKRHGHKAEVHWPQAGYAGVATTEQFIQALTVAVEEARKMDVAAKKESN